MSLLEVSDLTVEFYTDRGVLIAVDGVSFEIERGETVGIVGESGAGKSVLARSILGILDQSGYVERGEIRFKGRNLLELSDPELRSVRGNEVAMVFQEPEAALNPVYTVGEQISETIRHHLEYDRDAASERAIRLLERVGIPDAATRYTDFPHEFSGGMQQRVGIAMALSCDPDLLLCDEPTTGLDVTVEAQIVEEIETLAAEFDVAVGFITHDLGVIAELCDRVMVMYAGQVVETAPVESLFYDPKHPYTAGLLRSIPRLGIDRDRLQAIPGSMPDLIDRPSGCAFHPRCPFAEEVCTRRAPSLLDPETGEELTGTAFDRAAACLEYSGELTDGLSYEVVVDGDVADDPSNSDNIKDESRGRTADTNDSRSTSGRGSGGDPRA